MVAGAGFEPATFGFLSLVGLVVGLAGALAVTRLLSRLLFGIATTDPSTYVVVPVVLGLVTVLACYLPARRAARLEPTLALKYE